MNENLSLLIELQKLDLEIDRDEKERKKVLAEADRYTKEIEELEKDLLEKEAQLKKTKTEKRIKEGKIEEIDLLIAKHEEEKYKVKSQDEFAALEKEITLAKDQKEKVENLLLELMEKEEDLTNSIPLLREETESGNKNREIKRKKLATYLDNFTRTREKSEGERKNLTLNLNPVFLEQFERLKKTRDGLAVISTKNGACGGCHVKLSFSLMGRVGKGQGVVYCENCNRVLYCISDNK